MRISNPKTTAGGLPLATTWYVTKKYSDAIDYTDQSSENLSTYINQEISYTKTLAYENDGEIISAFCKWLTGNGNAYTNVSNRIPAELQPSLYGYAPLNANKIIDPNLLPDISIMDITVVDALDIINTLISAELLNQSQNTQEYCVYGDNQSLNLYNYALTIDTTDFKDVVNLTKAFLDIYIRYKQNTSDQKVFRTGDVLIVTYFNSNDILNRLTNDSIPSACVTAFGQSYIAGGWICSNPHEEERDNTTKIIFTKLSFNQGEIISINNTLPKENGEVSLTLAKIKKSENEFIGEVTAKEITYVSSTSSVPNALANITTTGLIDIDTNTVRFVFNDIDRNSINAYTTLNLFALLNQKTQAIVDILSAAIDELTNNTYIESINYLSSVIGNASDLSSVSVTSALLSLKKNVETTNENIALAQNNINTIDYDILKVYTVNIPSGSVVDVNTNLSNGIKVSAVSYITAHPEINLSEYGTIYDYFGLEQNPTMLNPDIAEITFTGFKGKILDIYVAVNDNKYEKIDADINYETDNSGLTGSFTILSEYDINAADTLNNAIQTAKIDRMIVHYTDKFKYNPETPNTLF